MLNQFIDPEVEEILKKRAAATQSRPLVFATGITSSHLGDERNLREFFIADLIVKYARASGFNVMFLLFDDSYDPLTFRQLRVAVKKDAVLIKKFEKYCGMPIKLIPDPYKCHDNYSAHFIDGILDRFHNLSIYPNVIDTYSSYDSGLYDFAKKIAFTQIKTISVFLKKQFPNYTMKKIFWPVCETCKKMDEAKVEEIKDNKVVVYCKRCKVRHKSSFLDTRGKFSWKIDEAVKWNVFNCDFEPFSKAYLDPNVGSFIIAKKLSEEFFGGHHPEIIQYGQVFMDKNLSYTLLPSLPRGVFDQLFLTNRKKDITISKQKVIHAAKNFLVSKDLSFYDYVQVLLPYENLETMTANHGYSNHNANISHGNEFARNLLHKDAYPILPTDELLDALDSNCLQQISTLINWVTRHKSDHSDEIFKNFLIKFNDFLKSESISKATLFPIIRKLLSQEDGAPMSRIFYHIPNQFLYSITFLLEKSVTNKQPL